MEVIESQNATYQLWVELKSNLHRFIARRARNDADAEDILQNVFFKIHLNIGRLRDSTKIHAWVYRITRNAIVDYYRSRGNELTLDTSPEAIDVAWASTSQADAEREEIMECLRPMIERLPESYGQALKMADMAGIGQAEVASHLNLSVSGAKSRVQRARAKMKDMLVDCCHLEFDRLGRAVGMDKKSCSSCGCNN